ncbi:MAG: DUF6033 family protein [Clostridium sp.]|nr:DUF6033 family protein [Acetatifactor muris]MCM1527380.1 DUF6033 family protein [Bacteroides sp.]MCM1563556.1 DUF6033 family protein [Clostridium sp.]
MSTISEVQSGTQAAQAAQARQTAETADASKKVKVSGKTVGNPQLSEKAAKYYEELKKKYSNMDFVLVSSDMKELAKSQAGSFANPYKLAVLIDEEKIERMAEDEDFRKQYESILNNAASGVSQLAQKLSATGAKVKGFGMQIDDGGNASFFAVVDKSLAAQRDRIAQKAADKKEAKRADEKKAKKEAEQERLHGSRDKDKDEVVITASSIDELIRKVEDMQYAEMSDRVQTEEEQKIGQQFDFSV